MAKLNEREIDMIQQRIAIHEAEQRIQLKLPKKERFRVNERFARINNLKSWLQQ